MYKLAIIDKRRRVGLPPIMIAKLVEFTFHTNFWDDYQLLEITKYDLDENDEDPPEKLDHLWYGYYIEYDAIQFKMPVIYKGRTEYELDITYYSDSLFSPACKHDYNLLFSNKLIIDLALENQKDLKHYNLKIINV